MKLYKVDKKTAEGNEVRQYAVTAYRDGEPLTGNTQQFNPHSIWKFFQAYALVSADTENVLTEQEIAVMCASHSGEDMHAEIIRGLLNKAGLSEEDLRCGPRNFFRSKRGEEIPDQCYCDCGGKHAGFLNLAKKLSRTPEEFSKYVEDYLNPDGVVQKEVLSALIRDGLVTEAEVASWKWEKDGCKAPIPVIDESTAARLFANLAEGKNIALERMFDATSKHPELVGGTDGRLVTELMKAGVKGDGDIVAKDGFGSVLALSILDNGQGLGVIIHDLQQDNFRDNELAVVLQKALQELGLPTERINEAMQALYGDQLQELSVEPISESHRELQRPVVLPMK